MNYFAYGSNLSLVRIRERLGRVPAGRVAELADHRLAFDKPAGDGSTYANILPAAGSVVRGVVYDCTEAEMRKLDGFEGSEYERRTFTVQTVDGSSLEAIAFVALTHGSGKPAEWYLKLILDGAAEHGLPPAYIDGIAAVGTRN